MRHATHCPLASHKCPPEELHVELAGLFAWAQHPSVHATATQSLGGAGQSPTDMHFVEPVQAMPVDVDPLVAVVVVVVADVTLVPVVEATPVVAAALVVADVDEAVEPAPPLFVLIGWPFAHAAKATPSERKASRQQGKRTAQA